ncbi:MAG: hypothetical protein Q9213_001410, partial [Squamulea squamosa]
MPIFINGELLYTPATLWRAIRRQYPQNGFDVFSLGTEDSEEDPKRPAAFWADAICINQESSLGKSHKIPFMDRIYGQARQVLVYVNESITSFSAMTTMKVIAQAAEQYEPWTIAPHNAIRKQLSRFEWDSVRDFISEQVFRRSWVIQETVLASKIIFCYGK